LRIVGAFLLIFGFVARLQPGTGQGLTIKNLETSQSSGLILSGNCGFDVPGAAVEGVAGFL
jgi:hypothetical protein